MKDKNVVPELLEIIKNKEVVPEWKSVKLPQGSTPRSTPAGYGHLVLNPVPIRSNIGFSSDRVP